MPTTYAIPDGRTVMAATTYTGNNPSTQSVSNAVNGVSFQPDFVWIKSRSAAYYNTLYDSVRGSGATKSIYSNTSDTEGTFSTLTNLSSFNSNGFTVGTTSSSPNTLNESGVTFVGWQWKAGGTSASNTNGSITSTVSVGATQGFSVVTYTHNGTNAATVGHGLGVTPSFIINKQRSAASNWRCYHVSLPAGYNIQLNLTQAQSVAGDIFQTAPTSSVFTPGNGDSASGQTMVAYCFAAVAGYSAFGSYVGNGSTDGPFIYTGFKPRFVLVKSSTAAQSWQMYDSTRNPSNEVNCTLFANGTNAESTSNGNFDFLSNGFKLRNGDFAINKSGESYIYMAFASNPTKYANAF